jgi:hypothetical protein
MENNVVMRKPAEIVDADHELVIERVCAIDVAKASGMLCTRLPQGAAGGRRGPARQPGVGGGGHHSRDHRAR